MNRLLRIQASRGLLLADENGSFGSRCEATTLETTAGPGDIPHSYPSDDQKNEVEAVMGLITGGRKGLGSTHVVKGSDARLLHILLWLSF